jgi:hypothetical protein
MTQYAFYGAAQGTKRYFEMLDWCRDTLYHGGYYEPKWSHCFPYIFFQDEKEYSLFLLRWS